MRPDRSTPLDAATRLVQAGLPVPQGTRMRWLKRVIARLTWFMGREQIAFNRSVVDELTMLETDLGAQSEELERQVAKATDGLPTHEDLRGLRDSMADLSRQFAELRARLDRERTVSHIHQAQVELFLSEVRRSLPEPPDPQRLAALPTAVDNLYVWLEEAFRGSSEEIRERAKEYLDDVRALDRRGPVLDIGCGRGEWLELLMEAGIDAYGIDTNSDFVAQCTGRGLDARLEDAYDHLRKCPERSLAAVSAFHVVEHVTTEQLVELLDLALRAIHPGGVVILETPNPDSLLVGASNFYIDPTHIRPLNPHFLAFLVGARGFGEVELRYKRPPPRLAPPPPSKPWAADLQPLIDAVNGTIYAPMDYAVVARRL